MMSIGFIKRTLSVFMLLVALASCADIPKETVPELYWPFPPEKPRIKFVDVIIGSIDVVGVRSGKFKRLLFGEEGEYGFNKPLFATAKGGVLYVTDGGLIHIYDFNKKKYEQLGIGLLKQATGIAVGSDGTIYVADSGRSRVYSISSDHRNALSLGPIGSFENPGGIAVDEKFGRLIVADSKKHDVSVWDLKQGTLLFRIGKHGSKPSQFNYPYDVAVDREGRIYVVDSANFRIQRFDKDGELQLIFGSVGTSPGNFARPKGIALNSEGHIYVVDAAFGNFQIFDQNGYVYLAVGTGGTDPGKFLLPIGIAIDEDDKIYVVDQLSRKIQVFQYIKYPEEKQKPPAK